MLFEASQKIKRQGESIDSLKTHARTIFSASSIIISLIGTLQIFNEIPSNYRLLYISLIIIMVILYIVLVILSLTILSPFQIYGPISIDEATLFGSFIGKMEREVILNQLSAYINVIKLNEPKIITRQKMTTAISILFAIIVFMILFIAILPYLDVIKETFLCK